jgi:hypothetical protein
MTRHRRDVLEVGNTLIVVPAKAGIHTPRPALLEKKDNAQRAKTISAGG